MELLEPAVGTRTLPDYDDPPVIETVLGVQFAPLPGWGVPHYGLFWNEIRSEYPYFRIQDAVPEDPGFSVGLQSTPTARIEFSTGGPLRCWFFDESRTKLVQVQSDRFMHNWIKRASDQPYLHYENVRPIFQRQWEAFLAFLERHEIPRPGMVQCEVTYVNHIQRGAGWSTWGDLPDVVALWAGKGSSGFLPDPDAVVLQARYPISPQAWLTVILEPAVRNSDGKEVIQLRLTSTALCKSIKSDDICACLDTGREWIVNGFTDMTTTKMHSLWKRKG
jgi:uncharacterized protein (TIGR04255 family)